MEGCRHNYMTFNMPKRRFANMKRAFAGCLFLFLFFSIADFGKAESIGRDFKDHGVAVPVSTGRGTVATADNAGRNVILVWLFDHRGSYALLVIDGRTGKTEEFPVPFAADEDGPFASLLSSRNRFYTHFNSHFLEFDVGKRAFTFRQKTAPKSAMSMTEDDQGVIWSATYPQSGVVSYNPTTGQFKDYGHVYKQNWDQYPRSIAADDAGWIYLGLGFAASQIIAFNPSTGTVLPILPEQERKNGMSFVYRDMDGKVYGKALEKETPWDKEQKVFKKALGQGATGWYQLYTGRSNKIESHPQIRPKEIITGNQELFHGAFPDGTRLAEINVAERRLVIVNPREGNKRRELRFDYSTEGGYIATVSAAPGGTIFGATMFPHHFFSYDPANNHLASRPCYRQWNTVVSHGEKVFVGGYPGGFIMEWDPSRAWQPDKDKPGWNPTLITPWANPIINRPSKLLALPDGKTVVMAGTPDYGLTGGGLAFWNRENRKMQVLSHLEVIPDQSTHSLLALPGNLMLGGTTIAAGTGGEKKARYPELYLMDVATKKVLWHHPVIQGLQEYTDLCQGPRGMVYGLLNRGVFFVFDPVKRKIIHQANSPFGPATWQQGPRVLIPGSNETVYILFPKGIVRIDPKNYSLNWLADSPVPITAGGVYSDGRIYFAGGDSHLYSCKVD